MLLWFMQHLVVAMEIALQFVGFIFLIANRSNFNLPDA
jgi:hypothetical protein